MINFLSHIYHTKLGGRQPNEEDEDNIDDNCIANVPLYP